MVWQASVGRNWSRLRDRVKREFLRDPFQVLIERAPEPLSDPAVKVAAADQR